MQLKSSTEEKRSMEKENNKDNTKM